MLFKDELHQDLYTAFEIIKLLIKKGNLNLIHNKNYTLSIYIIYQEGENWVNYSVNFTPVFDVIIKCVDELFLPLDAISITHQSILANKELCHGTSIINSRGVTENGVCGNRFISSGDIERQGVWI